MYSPEELALEWGVHVETVRRLLRVGALRGIKVGRQWRVSKEAVAEYLSEASEPRRE